MFNNVSPNRPEPKGETSSIQRRRPNTAPRTDDFKKLYRKDAERSKEPEEEEDVAVDEKAKDSPPSLFDLSKKAPKQKSTFRASSEIPDPHSSLEENPGFQAQGAMFAEEESFIDKPFQEANDAFPKELSLFQTPNNGPKNFDQAQLAKTLQLQQEEGLKEEVESAGYPIQESGQALKKEKSKESSRSSNVSEEGKPDPALVHAGIQAVAFQTEKAQQIQETTQSAMMEDLAAQIIDRIQVMRKEDQTSTIVTLRHPPILAGATLTLIASDHAKREFNISFANLSPDAKLMLDRKLNEDSLTATLERKGITVHMITTSTQPDNLFHTKSSQPSRDQQQDEQQQQGKQQSEDEE